MTAGLQPSTDETSPFPLEKLTALIIEDNSDQRRMLCDMIMKTDAFSGFCFTKVHEASNYEQVMDRLETDDTFGLILLDCDFPKSPGQRPERLGKELCRVLLEEHVNCPVIAISGVATDDEDEDDFLIIGATDYMRKPLSPRVLLTRIQKRLVEFRDQPKVEYKIGQWTYSPGKQQILHDGRVHDKLTRAESAILHILCRMRGTVVPRRDLLMVLNHAPNSTTHTLATHVYRLRQKLEVEPSNPQYIVTGKNGLVLKD